MNYAEWTLLKVGDRVIHFTYGKGTIITNIGVGYVVQFDDGNKVKITDGGLNKCK